MRSSFCKISGHDPERITGKFIHAWMSFPVNRSSSFPGNLPIKVKGSSDPSHFIFEINVGKSRIRHRTTLKLNDEFLDRLKMTSFKFRVVLCRIRLFPTLISKLKWLGSGLPLSVVPALNENLRGLLRTNKR